MTTLSPRLTTVNHTMTEEVQVRRLNYIGSKFRLLDWLTESIQQATGWESVEGRRIGDIFGGTGIVSHHLRSLGATVFSNDKEPFSAVITRAFTSGVYTETCRALVCQLNEELEEGRHTLTGYVTRHYSPFEESERQFFTIENARAIDYLRQRLEEERPSLDEDEYNFLLASLLISADAISNVPAVYGCYLKAFKAKARKKLVLEPIHTNTKAASDDSRTTNLDVTSHELLTHLEADLVYLDPPYNGRQYSKNYFPLNIITKTPTELEQEPPLKGKTGIPQDCYLSPFCRKGRPVEEALETLFRDLRAEWILLSYNSEAIVPKERVLELMSKYGTATVQERDYKRFKSFKYNDDKKIQEYLFCLHKSA